MPIHHAVLAMLAEGPSHGYELKATFEEAIGPQWGELNIGHLYQVLDRLVRDGFVRRREVPQRGRPDRVDYRLTARGRRELEAWLERPFVRQAGYRDELFLKIFGAARLGPEALQTVLRTQRQAYVSELATLGQLRTEHRSEPLIALLIEAAIRRTEGNLEILEITEDRAEELSSAEPVTAAPGRADSARLREAQ